MGETHEADKGQQQIAPKAVAESAESLGPRAVSKESLNKDAETDVTPEANKIKFTKNENETAVHIGEVEVAFAGLGKDELMKYANDPFWKKIRWTLFILFWIGWIGMLIAAIVIVVLAPKCPPPKPLTYWQKGVVYHTEVKSFQDGEPNQDGSGDIKGIIGRLGHLEQLGINMLVLPPIFKQDDDDTKIPYGYGVVDFETVNPMYGTLEDVRNLVQTAEAHKDIKVILDFIPNHSSNKHKWFIDSASETPQDYADYYIWKNCSQSGDFPNNLTNIFNSSAWTYEPKRKQCYYHAYGSDQPDLNLRNEKVLKELDNILRYWLDQGVAGFRLLSVPFLYESDDDAVHLPESFEFVGRVRSILKSYEEKDGKERILLVDPENYAGIEELSYYYGTSETSQLADLPINNLLIYQWNATSPSASHLRQVITDYLTAPPSWGWPTWVVGNRDRSRIGSRLGDGRENLTDAIAMLQMLLPGTPITYYGDEIGMQDVAVDSSQNCGVEVQLTEAYNCNKARSPFQWDETPETAGFTNATKPWHPVAPSDVLEEINAKAQLGKTESHLGIYQELVALRNQPAIMHGNCSFPDNATTNNDDVISFIRIRKGAPGYIVTLNLSPEPKQKISFEGVEGVPSEAHVVLGSSKGLGQSPAKGESVDTRNITLGGFDGLVLSFAPEL